VFKRGRLVGALQTKSTVQQEIRQILVFGTWIIGCGEQAIEVWKSDTYEHYTTISTPEHGRAVFTGRACNLPTFLNKIFVGRHDGTVEVYNVSTGKLVHAIMAPSAASGTITALCASSALSMLAIAYGDGSLRIHDVQQDETAVSLRPGGAKQPVTSISFRSDGQGAGEDGRADGIMATASIVSGDITLWDLNKGGRIAGVLRSAHETSSRGSASGINKIEFLQGQPVMISSGLDNAIRSWIFDQTPFSAVPRILHTRRGHAAPVNKVQFLPASSDGSDAAGKWLLSAGSDRSLWGFSLRKDAQSTEISQGNVKHKAKKVGHVIDEKSATEELKAPPITAIACSLNRDGGMGGVGGSVWQNVRSANAEEAGETGWESIITAHEEDNLARTWFWGRKKAGRWTFETGDQSTVTSVAITSCGTFALVGSAGGSLDMFNLQSGIHRQRFPPKMTAIIVKKLKEQQLITGEDNSKSARGHTITITGVVVDNLNQTVLSASLDGSVIFWDFLTGRLVHRIRLDAASPTAMHYNQTSGLVSLACDDLCIRILDIETRRIVRELWGCVGQIYDHCFSHDGRWIVACSMDSVVRVFDLATGRLIDAFRTATCTNVAFSSTGEFLATTHSGSIGINIWNNKTLSMHVPIGEIDEESGIIDLTNVASFNASSRLAVEDLPDSDDLINAIGGVSEIDQLDSKLLTLSLVPQSRWQTLLNLESIRERNKPVQPPEKPKAAPFFLGSSLANGNKDVMQNPPEDAATQAIEVAERSRISKLVSLQPVASPFTALLRASVVDSTDLLAHLTHLSPSAADLEIRSLMIAEMPVFVRALTAQLRRRKDFELVNTWMSVFLKMHGDFISEVTDLRDATMEWRDVMRSEEQRLAELVGYVKGVVGFLRSAR
jgi:U3 small nucleolar RNA-associated protein 21